MKGRRLVVGSALLGALALSGSASAASPAPPPAGAATDGPGALSHFALARKDCAGTARNRDSKVWSRSPTAS